MRHAYVLKKYFQTKGTIISSKLSMRSIQDELLRKELSQSAKKLLEKEKNLYFLEVQKMFRVITDRYRSCRC